MKALHCWSRTLIWSPEAWNQGEGHGMSCRADIWSLDWQVNLVRAFHTTDCLKGTLSSVGLHTDEEFKAFTPWDGYNKNITYRNGRCPARVYMDDIHKLVKQKFWGDPFPGEKLITHRVSLHDEAAVREAYDKFEKRIDNCTKVTIAKAKPAVREERLREFQQHELWQKRRESGSGDYAGSMSQAGSAKDMSDSRLAAPGADEEGEVLTFVSSELSTSSSLGQPSPPVQSFCDEPLSIVTASGSTFSDISIIEVPIPQHTCQQHQVIQTLSVPKGKLHTEQQADMFILPEVSMQEISSAADDMRALELEWQRMLEAEGISTAAGWHDETGRDAEQIVQDMLYSLAPDGGSSSALFRDIQVLLVLATQGKHSCLAILEAGGVAVLVSSLPSAQLSMQGLILATLAELITSNPQHASCNPEAEPGLVPALLCMSDATAVQGIACAALNTLASAYGHLILTANGV
ncbi:hypothetical protein WJX84_000518 [Apatococcus fuscideae]|uniref:Uncharacterized protein n=1 Tax=Apatococcus fuscideae TaxID=2026836 RepID=A0AAW1T5I2_9CHLO